MTSSGIDLRVLFLATAFPARGTDPRGNHVFRLARQLVDAGVTVGAVAPIVPGADTFESLGGVAVHRFRYSPLGREQLAKGVSGIIPNLKAKPHLALQVPPLVAQMARMARKLGGDYDLLHAHWMYPAGAVALNVGKRLQIPVVVTAHGSDVNMAVRTPGLRSLVRRVGNSAAAVLSVSDDLRNKLISVGVRADRLVTVPLGITVPPETVRRDAGTVPTLLYIGSLISLKAVDTLLRALAEIPPASVHVQIIGDGPERAKLEATATKAGLDVIFRGELSPDEVLAALDGADMLVLPSQSEGRPTVVLEAMAHGVAVIASDIPGTRELVRHNETGLLFPVGDSEALGRCIATLAGSAATRNQLAQAGLRSLRDMGLSGDVVARRHVEVYRRVLSTAAASQGVGEVAEP